tara:strand:+ start:4037 stop:4381 length:345 start_codon:yes stop_codon:yes gene_type:complete
LKGNILNIISEVVMSKEENFEIFWKLLLGRRVNKKKAKEVYLKIKTDLTPELLAERFNRLYLLTNEEKYVPHPERWLRNERWNDELDESKIEKKIYRDQEGFIISEEEWKKQNR